jgi:hypothetical protein
LAASLLFDFADNNGLGGFTATKAIAAAADISVTTLAMRTSEKKRFRLNERGVFICLDMLRRAEVLPSLGESAFQDK